jgi:Rab GDP dissociation inhibitor
MRNTLQATAPGIYVATIVLTIADKTGNPDEDVMPGLQLLGPILKRFMSMSMTYEPVGDALEDNCFISRLFDATSNFESNCDDLLSLHERVTGEDLDMIINADLVEGDY